MRFVLDQVGDVEVDPGTTFGACRADLERLTGGQGVDSGAFAVDGCRLADDHVAGAPPWVHGSVLTASHLSADVEAAAVTAPWHVAVVAGPDAGLVSVPGRDAAVRVGRRTQPGDVPGRLDLSDPTVSRHHVEIRAQRRRGGRRGDGRWVVRDTGSANGTVLLWSTVRGRERRRRLTSPSTGPLRRSARTHAITPGDVLVVGDTRLVLRRPEDVPDDGWPGGWAWSPPGASGASGQGTGGPRATVGSGRDGRRSPSGAEAQAAGPTTGSAGTLAWVLPILVSIGLAVSLRNPVLLLLGLSGTLGALLPRLARRRQSRPRGRVARRWPRRRPPGPAVLVPDAATSSVRLARLRTDAPLGHGASTQGTAGDGATGHCAPPAWWHLVREGLAVVGAADASMGAARTLLGAALLADVDTVSVLTDAVGVDAWTWCRWLGPRAPAQVLSDASAAAVLRRAPQARTVVVAVGAGQWRTALDRWWLETPADERALLLLAPDRDAVPPWCRWVLTLGSDGVGLLQGPGLAARVGVPSATRHWIEAHARRLVSQEVERPADDRSPGPALPRRVSLGDLGLPGTTAEVRRAWGRTAQVTARDSLVAALGTGAGGRHVELDLVADGPHLLVAGTTGSGKSELLQSMLLSLALRHPPSEVVFVLVDYKGGAGFGRCRDMPHVVGQVTDLDGVEAGRALDGVRAELVRRKDLLAAQGVSDLAALRRRRRLGAVPPRLVVVVDEFRAMTEELPDFVPGLVRVASQGRSLGIHLVLATQRPAGAVSAEMRANVTARLCLRVADAADSIDVVGVPEAARLPSDVPGRGLLRRGSGPLEALQTPWAALPPAQDRGVAPAVLRKARPWTADAVPLDDARDHPTSVPGPTDRVGHLVRLLQQSAAALDATAPQPVWLPPLPSEVATADLPALLGREVAGAAGVADSLPLAVTDLPDRQSRGLLTWHGTAAPLAVAGGAGSGRTTALRTAAHAALRRGWHVHVVSGSPTTGPVLPADGAGACHPGVGAVVTAEDPRSVARLLAALLPGGHAQQAGGPARPPVLLLVDDVGVVSRALDGLPRGAASDLLERVLRLGRHDGVRIMVAGSVGDLVRLLPHCAERLVLQVSDPLDDAAMGVPRGFGGARLHPGGGVHLGPSGPVRCQVLRPEDLTAAPLADPVGGLSPHGTSAPLRIVPVPRRVDRTDLPGSAPDGTGLPGSAPDGVALGRGGDDGGVVLADVGLGLLVVGPAGSGRSTALATVALALRAQGERPTLLAGTGPLADVGGLDPERHGRTRASAADLLRLLDGASHPGVVLVDDIDVLARTDPAADEVLTRWALAAEAGDRTVPRLVVSARTDRAATTYRGAVAALRGTAPTLVLAPSTVASADVAGADLSLAVDPTDLLRRGAGVLVHCGRLVCVQVAADPGVPVSGGS